MNTFELIKDLQNEFKESSDRASVIVSGSLIDKILEDILNSFLIDDAKSDKEIFEGFGPLSSFSAKIKICYRLGLISQYEYKKLETFRSIRNYFAHEIQNCSLDSVVMKDKVKNLIIDNKLIPPINIPIPKYHGQIVPLPKIEEIDTTSPRDILEKFMVYIVNNLGGRFSLANKNKVSSPPEFEASYEPLESMHEYSEQIKRDLESRRTDHHLEMTESESESEQREEVLSRVIEYVIIQIKKSHNQIL